MYFKKGSEMVSRRGMSSISAYNKNKRGETSTIQTFKDYFKALYDKPWHENILFDSTYIEKALTSTEEPIRLETFHSSKGSEAGHVIVMTDLTSRVAEDLHTDDELRCLYVAVTRSKEKLTIVAPSNTEHYPLHYFTEER